MNILIYNTSFFQLSETFILNQVKILNENFNITLLAHNFENSAQYDSIKIESIPKNYPERIKHYFNRKVNKTPYLLPPLSQKKVIEEIKKRKIDCIHIHFGNNALKLLPIAKKLNIPIIVSFHGYDASELLFNKDYTNKLPELFLYARKIILCTSSMIGKLEKYGLKKSKTQIINYGVDIKLINSLSKNTNKEKITIIHGGRLAQKKGVPDLIKSIIAIKKENNDIKLELKIIGNGDDYNECKQLISKHNTNYIKLMGALPHLKLLQELKNSDIFVLNSRIDQNGDSEGFPNSIIEAMVAQTTVLSTYHAGIPEIIKHNETGLLIEEQNNIELKKNLLMLIQNKKLRDHLCKKAYAYATNELSITQMNTKIVQLFKNSN